MVIDRVAVAVVWVVLVRVRSPLAAVVAVAAPTTAVLLEQPLTTGRKTLCAVVAVVVAGGTAPAPGVVQAERVVEATETQILAVVAAVLAPAAPAVTAELVLCGLDI
jgi:hypothetical protein